LGEVRVIPPSNSNVGRSQRLVAEAIVRLKNPTKRTPERERILFTSMAAESLKLEGTETSAEDVLAAVEGTEV
jgi:hypothetical protein